ncbi:hydantoinase B/oxoprolinase family protein [Anatilimnocola floriformis]|uniref:hydantoinase B/oxoprolinase family protein n=1 Tax=Anatilimnocola floriformis TaxID=2948575 RepID=UPI0020C30505|nr:hydantoinase B/oxoprolinase family protein [Anatilimnocola floriformis]
MSEPSTPRWSFWLDVGGTFTDCLALRPDGVLLRRKVLSSARVKGRGDVVGGVLHDAARNGEPVDFWRGCELRVLDEKGEALQPTLIRSSDVHGRLHIELEHGERSNAAYEIISPEPAPILAIRLFLGLRLDEAIPPSDVKLGTTKGTNALLTRTGARTAFITTAGFADLLRIGYQNRPHLFARNIRKIEPLHEVSVEVDERLAADGAVLRPLDLVQARAQLDALCSSGIESLAICLLHAWKNPEHELQLKQLAREIGFREISISHRISPGMKIVPRGDTTLVDAYLNPVLREYVGRLQSLLPGSELRLMTSAGSLVRAANFSGKDSVLSGPAGGVTGFARAAESVGYSRAIGFDMGGTSTDVARYDGRFAVEYETQKAGVRLVTPMLAVETVAAGGGSICRWDGVKLTVGPASAGSDPGPACYGRGGPLTITDCNFFLGRIVPEHFPFPLERAAVERRLQEVLDVMATKNSAGPMVRPAGYSLAELAAGFISIANAHMAATIRSVSIARGYDVREDLLVAFGAAAAQHACAVARQLGIKRILSHPDAGVLSALGIGLADVIQHEVHPLYLSWDDALQRSLPAIFRQLEERGRVALAAEGVAAERIEFGRELDLRYQGTDVPLKIREPRDGDWVQAFAAEHQQRYGYVQTGRGLMTVAARVMATGKSSQNQSRGISCSSALHPGPLPDVPRRGSEDGAALIIRRDSLQPGEFVDGPAVIVEPLTTTIIDAGWRAKMLSGGELLIEDSGEQTLAPKTDPSIADPVLLEIFNQQFTAIATQMGHTLRNTSVSVNVKERLDFSCAIFTATGELVVNAPHIPVHLGAMSETVKSVLRDCRLRPGDVVVTNDPYRGGSHLPDVTVVTPVFDSQHQLLFFTASRAHHAEIGGITPGSMPPFSKCLAEEGVLIRNFKVVDAGSEKFAELAALLTSGPYPSRAVDHNLADIRAQLAANQQGANELLQLVQQQSLAVVQAYMQHIRVAAEAKTRQAIARLKFQRAEFVDHLDDGTRIQVAISVDPAREQPLRIDFTGTAGVHPGNLNANRAIVTAAVLYSLRLLIDEDIPLNQGVLAPVELIIPPGLLNPPAAERPEDCPAIVGGNVETSQRVVDVLLAAFGLAAASQGTMNNLLFGDATFGYYETICGGSGATATGNGADAVHTHMTNTRITDPEVLEHRFPVRLQRFAIRHGSGGQGQHCGGAGVIREIMFLQPMTVSLLTQRRGDYPPFGLHGGEAGKPGKNELIRENGDREELPDAAQFQLRTGDVLTVQTPGGGGWGTAS